MPKLTDTLPKYRKHRATGQAVVTLSGRDFYLGHHGGRTSRLEYDRLIGEWLANGRQSIRVTADELSVAELCLRYLKFARIRYVKNGRPTSEQAAILAAIRFLRRTYSNQPASSFGPLALKAIRGSMIEADLAITTINKQVGRIRRMFRWGVAEELVRPDVYDALRALQGLTKGRGEARETRPITPIDDSIVDATLPHLPLVVADVVRFQRLTGCRPVEACILRPCDVDVSEGVWEYRPARHKTEHLGRERVIPIGPLAQAVLLRYLARDTGTFCFRPVDSEAKRRSLSHAARRTPLTYGNRPGTNRQRRPKKTAGDCYTTDSYRRAIHRACDKAFPAPSEIANDPAKLAAWQSDRRWSPNQLRHRAATEVRRQYGLEATQAMLGHASADVTQIYAESNYRLAMQVAREVG